MVELTTLTYIGVLVVEVTEIAPVIVVEVILTGKIVVEPVITVEVAGVTDRLPEIRRAPVESIVKPLKVDVA